MSLVENLIHDYGDFKIEIPRWEIADRGVTALWGPSGAGKTSVFRLLLGLESNERFSWTMNGVNLAAVPPGERRFGVVFQTFELFPHMTAEENIRFAARARQLSHDETNTRFEMLKKELRLESFLSRKAAVLSGGESQRVALARAVVAPPRILFLDEPFSSLDADMKAGARAMVAGLIKKLEAPTLLITHDQADLDALADHVVKIENGRLV
jgi:ABC-type sugar transport system ATPase subunit